MITAGLRLCGDEINRGHCSGCYSVFERPTGFRYIRSLWDLMWWGF